MPSTAQEPRLLDKNEAADYLGRSVHTINGWRWRGKGPAYTVKLGRVFYDTADLDAWIASHTTRVVPEAVAS